MRKTSVTALVMFLVVLLVACAAKNQKKVEQEIKQPINCATAQGDIRVLQHEKAHVAQEAAEGVTAILPAGLVLGVVTVNGLFHLLLNFFFFFCSTCHQQNHQKHHQCSYTCFSHFFFSFLIYDCGLDPKMVADLFSLSSATSLLTSLI